MTTSAADRARTLIAAIAVMWLPVQAAAQDSLAAARDLYATAAYDEALGMLDRLRVASGDAPTIEQYRAFCLIALGRTDEAEQAVEKLVAIDPTWTLPAEEAPPRIQSLFASVRQRAVPMVLRERFAAAKTLHTDKRHAEAAAAFEKLLALIDTPEIAGMASSATADLRTVASGFLELTRSALAAEKAAATSAPVESAAQASSASLPGGSPGPASGGGTPPANADSASRKPPSSPTTRPASPIPAPSTSQPPARAEAGTIQGPVVPPAVISQQIPRPTGSMPLGGPAVIVLDVLIDENGRVERPTIRQSINRLYEAQLLAATRAWRYTPALQNGKPVKYVKTLEITLTPR